MSCMINCRFCDTSLEYVFSVRDDAYIDILWCRKCGYMVYTDEDDQEEYISEATKEYNNKGE